MLYTFAQIWHFALKIPFFSPKMPFLVPKKPFFQKKLIKWGFFISKCVIYLGYFGFFIKRRSRRRPFVDKLRVCDIIAGDIIEV